eukprot:TRINITY_DN17307_c0_g1_i1.p1 TRINITY_DN17307_c0_g1~~TRINITY_DN17307_c0_g1_i1.p1  ORF type:complete len:640 (+),score=72.97 TRINITY_DN17307_c0_g1_i1:179-2098(+)
MAEHLREPMSDHDVQVPPKSNKCTDVSCLLVLIANCFAMSCVMRYVSAEGNIKKLSHGYDWRLQTCGFSPSVASKSYLYWCATDIGETLKLSDGICVDSCPSSNQTFSACPGDLHFYNRSTVVDGIETYDFGVTRTLKSVRNYPSKHFPFLMYCFPDSTKDDELFKQVMTLIMSKSRFRDNVLVPIAEGILSEGWQEPTIVAMIAVVLCYLFVVLMRFFLRITAYIFTSFLVVLWFGLAFSFTYGYFHPANSLLATFTNSPRNPCLYVAIAMWVLTVPVMGLVLCIFCRLTFVIKTMEDAGDALLQMPSMLLVPIVQIILQLAIICAAGYGFLWIVSLGEVKPHSSMNVFDPESWNPKVTSVTRTFEFTEYQYWLMAYWVLSTFWILHIALAAGSFVISFAVANSRRTQRRCLPLLCQGYLHAYTLHLGTLSVGAFILGMMWILAEIVRQLFKQTQSSSGSRNKVSRCLECCCVNCMVCLARSVQHLNTMTYTEVAISGNGYCRATLIASRYLVSNAGVFTLIHFVTRVVKFFGICVITIGGTWLCFLLKSKSSWRNAIESTTTVEIPDNLFVNTFELGFNITNVCVLLIVSTAFMEVYAWVSISFMYVIICIKATHGDRNAPYSRTMIAASANISMED